MRTFASTFPAVGPEQTLVSGYSEDDAFLLGYTPPEDATTLCPVISDLASERQLVPCVLEDLAATAEIPGLPAYRTLSDAIRLYGILLGRFETQQVSYGQLLGEDDLALGRFLYATFCSTRPHYAALLEPYLFLQDQWRYCASKD